MEYNLKSKIETWDLKDKKVFYRVDLNVPLINGIIENDFKLQAIRPTLDFLISKKAQIILATHIGRPNNLDNNLSTQNLLSWFKNNNYQVKFAQTLEDAKKYNFKDSEFILLENLRFYSGEQSSQEYFAQELKSLARFYVNDAFGASHRDDTSITLLPRLFDIKDKSIGFLIEKELENLNKLKDNPKEPFVLIMGGGKISQKIPLIDNLLDQVNTILLCPATVFTFLYAQGYYIGNSLIDTKLIDDCLKILKKAQEKKVQVIFPIDYLVKDNLNHYKIVEPNNLNHDLMGISIGPKTVEYYSQIILNAKTIFFNGLPGFLNDPETMKPIKTLLQTIAQSNAYSVIGGGESVAAVFKYGLNKAINFCSTGGGATLQYLSNKPLPGIESIIT